MERDVPGIDDPDSDWGHRRENLRHEVQVPARITDRLGVTSNAIIEDISSTGMALRIEPVAAKAGSEPFQRFLQEKIAVMREKGIDPEVW